VGAYFRIIEEGDIGANDIIEVIERPAHGVMLDTMVGALHDLEKARALQAVEVLPGFWRRVADRGKRPAY
jgi:MOSC domain-containing protein YiiM